MRIGVIAKQAGVGVETVRFYERTGLLERPPTPMNGGYRSYPRDAVDRIQFIRQAQNLGFSLKEIGDLLSLQANPSAACADVRRRAEIKLEDVMRKIDRLTVIGRALGELIAACPGSGRAARRCSILEALAKNHALPSLSSHIRSLDDANDTQN